MKYLKRIFESEKVLAYFEKVKDVFPDEIGIYTSNGSFKLKKSDITREADIIRAPYYHNTAADGNVEKDGEPDYLYFDIHFSQNENGVRTLVDITYGDQMKSEFSIEKPNKINVIHYNGINSIAEPETHFGFEDSTIEDLCKLFNSFDFGYNLKPEDLNFIDKYLDTYKYESLKLTPLRESEVIMFINNTKPDTKRYLGNILNYLKVRGINFQLCSSSEEIDECMKNFNVVGAISSGSEYTISKSKYETKLSNYAFSKLKCPVLGICYGMQCMVEYYGGVIKDSKEITQTHKKLTHFNKHNFLFQDFDISNIEWSFSHRDVIEKMPPSFKSIAMCDSEIVGISNEELKRYGILFHPEDVEMCYPLLDNFINKCGGSMNDQENILQGKFEHLKNFKDFN